MAGRYVNRRGGHAGVGIAVVPLLGLLSAAFWATDGTDDPSGGLWVDPENAGARQSRVLEERGYESEARLLRRIADRPMAVWLTERDPGPRVARITARASDAGKTPVLVAYNIPQRDCGQYSAGGARSTKEYLRWVGRVAQGIGDRKALVVLEPDAVPHAVAGCPAAGSREGRMALLARAVDTLAARPGASVYIDAGNASWVRDVDGLAESLTAAGVKRAAGFSLNVANFQTTEASQAYGDKLSKALGGSHYVIDTSRNGNGPPRTPPDQAGAEPWCNPPDRALGVPPTTRTGHPRVDAYLWVKRPGESDGTCRGGPPAGQWWTRYALQLARSAIEHRPPWQRPTVPGTPTPTTPGASTGAGTPPGSAATSPPPASTAPTAGGKPAGTAASRPAPTGPQVTSHAPTSPSTGSPARP